MDFSHVRKGIVLLALISVLAVLPACGGADRPTQAVAAGQVNQVRGESVSDSIVIQWNNAMIEAQRQHGLPPTAQARALAIMHTCMYDAWAAYDSKAVGTRLGATLRRPAGERTLANKQKAISFAAYRSAVDLYANDKTAVFDALMSKLGYDVNDTSTDKATPSGVGNSACQAVLDFRHTDGSNQSGNTPGGTAGEAYSDYTGYKPVNDTMDLSKPFDPATVKDVAHWQPLMYTDENGKLVTPTFLAAQWGRVAPFALTSATQFLANRPAKPGTDPFKAQAQELLDASAKLTETQKVQCGWWANGPNKELPPGYWSMFAQYVARRDAHGAGMSGVDKDVKLFFALTNALFDASIAGWGVKREVDYVRPITAIRVLFQGQDVQAWGGPGKGTQTIKGETWLPYHPNTFPTPPFAEYVSGHSVFGGAGAELLKLFTGNDNFGDSVTIKPGSNYGYDEPTVPTSDVTLSWKTFTAAADEAGVSRIYCGMHFAQGNVDGLDMGRKVAAQAFQKAQTFVMGTAVVAGAPTALDTLPRTF
jgi:hypothetical protein